MCHVHVHSLSALLQSDCGMKNIAGNYVLASSGRMATCIKHTKRVASSVVEHTHCHRSSSEEPHGLGKVDDLGSSRPCGKL